MPAFHGLARGLELRTADQSIEPMKKLLFALLASGACATATKAQFQVNPQAGLTFQNLTNASPGVEFRAAAGWQLGADLRFGDRVYVQPGAFFGSYKTYVTNSGGDTITAEDNFIRQNLRLKAMIGYRIIDSYQFDMRFAVGPTFDALLGIKDKNGTFVQNEDYFNKGVWNIDAALGFDMGLVTLEPSVSFGLSRVLDQDEIVVKDVDSRYITYGFTLGINLGNDDKE
jgi:hypothetical protein